MKLNKIASLVSLFGLLAATSPQTATAGIPSSGFFAPPFGRVNLACHVFEATSGSPPQHATFNTHRIMLLVIDAINANEGGSYTLPPGGHLWFDGDNVLLRNANGSTYLNLSDSPLGANYLDIFFSDGISVERRTLGNKLIETDLGFVEIEFNANPPIFTRATISAPPAGFTLTGSVKISFAQKPSSLTDSGRMSGFGSGFLENEAPISIRWHGTIGGREIFSSPK